MSDVAAVAASMPFLSAIGLAPAVTARRPPWTMAWASTVAVVVPSPAMSLVLVATSLASWAPRFSLGSSSSTSRATVTPSLVMVGAPHFLSITTLRPRGPSVTFTASASRFTPRSSARRASSSNSSILAAMPSPWFTFLACGQGGWAGWRSRHRPRRLAPGAVWHEARALAAGHRPQRRIAALLLLHDGEHVTSGEHEVLLVVVLDLGAAVLAVQHHVADLDIHGHALGARVVEATRADRENLALLGLLLRGVRDDQARRGRLLGLERTDHDAVFERLENNLGGGRHDLTSPSKKAGCIDSCIGRATVTACRRGCQTTMSR